MHAYTDGTHHEELSANYYYGRKHDQSASSLRFHRDKLHDDIDTGHQLTKTINSQNYST